MSSKKSSAATSISGADFDVAGANIIDTPLSDEVETSYLEYAYSVIHSRALPDVRDGLKPVHRRILYGMKGMGLRPDAAQVKAARVVGEVLGRYHPHGDSSVYDAMVRMAQDFSLNTVLVHGHGNWGSPNDGAAAMRYTECKLAAPAMLMVSELDEDTVDMAPNYDGSLQEPVVLPAAFPNLLVNGASGIAVGMATNMIPHNLAEVVSAARALIRDPDIELDELMRHIPGPDLPTGGLLLGADQVRAAYESGRGTVRIRARAEIGPLEGSRGRQQITFTELPYQVGTEKIIESVKAELGKKRLAGISDVKDLSDREFGTRLVVECKTGVNPQALLGELYKYTPLETSFGIANLALVDGTPKVLGLRDVLLAWVDFRREAIVRRTRHRLAKAEGRQHIVEGLLIALDAVEKVVRTIRASKDTAAAREALMSKFKLSEIQASHILEMPLRRLVALEVDTLRAEMAELTKTITGLRRILDDAAVLSKVMDDELAQVTAQFGAPRRTELVDGNLKDALASGSTGPVEVPDEPCRVGLSTSGLLIRTPGAAEEVETGRARRRRSGHDSFLAVAETSTRGAFVAVTDRGRGYRVNTLHVPAAPRIDGFVSARGGVRAVEVAPVAAGETVVAVIPAGQNGRGVALGTSSGVVKVCAPDWPARSDDFDLIGLQVGDRVVGAGWVADADDELVFVTSAGQLLHFPAGTVRPQGRSGGGVAGVRIPPGVNVVGFNVVPSADVADAVVFTQADGQVKVSAFSVFPGKGRGTGGVRAHRLSGTRTVQVAWVGVGVHPANQKGDPVAAPEVLSARDGAGAPAEVAAEIVGAGFVQHLQPDS